MRTGGGTVAGVDGLAGAGAGAAAEVVVATDGWAVEDIAVALTFLSQHCDWQPVNKNKADVANDDDREMLEIHPARMSKPATGASVKYPWQADGMRHRNFLQNSRALTPPASRQV